MGERGSAPAPAGQEVASWPACGAAEIAELLEKTSRTFALAIPLLPDPTRLQVGIAYLLFRIADTFEDAELWPGARKLDALDRFGRLLRHPAPEQASRAAEDWAALPPCCEPGYLELLASSPAVLGSFWNLAARPREIIGDHTLRTVEGMAGFVGRAGEKGALELRDLDDLKRYCYVVAGIVGEMLTELFLDGREKLEPLAGPLRERAACFGEALQLVNIAKDTLSDARVGRRFLPESCMLAEVFALARRDIDVARGYTLALQDAGAPRGIVAFTALPIRLAQATLDLVEAKGPGAKLSRSEVAAVLRDLQESLDRRLPVV